MAKSQSTGGWASLADCIICPLCSVRYRNRSRPDTTHMQGSRYGCCTSTPAAWRPHLYVICQDLSNSVEYGSMLLIPVRPWTAIIIIGSEHRSRRKCSSENLQDPRYCNVSVVRSLASRDAIPRSNSSTFCPLNPLGLAASKPLKVDNANGVGRIV